MSNTIWYPETTGIVNQIDRDKNKKLAFFEIDTHDLGLVEFILSQYRLFHLDVLYHKTKMGFHFLSPTLIDLDTWKRFHDGLKTINPKCPMITLRVQGNKYPDESEYFYRFQTRKFRKENHNVKSVCDYLNRIFGSNLEGSLPGDLQLVHYRPHMRDE